MSATLSYTKSLKSTGLFRQWWLQKEALGTPYFTSQSFAFFLKLGWKCHKMEACSSSRSHRRSPELVQPTFPQPFWENQSILTAHASNDLCQECQPQVTQHGDTCPPGTGLKHTTSVWVCECLPQDWFSPSWCSIKTSIIISEEKFLPPFR